MKLLIVLVTAVVDINAAAAFVAAFVAAVADGGVIAAAAYVAFVAAVADDMLWKQMAYVFGSISPMRMSSKKAALQKR